MTGYLLDTHILLWAAQDSASLGEGARDILSNPKHDILISVASIWEVVIKCGLGRRDLAVDPVRLRELAIRAGFCEPATPSRSGANGRKFLGVGEHVGE